MTKFKVSSLIQVLGCSKNGRSWSNRAPYFSLIKLCFGMSLSFRSRCMVLMISRTTSSSASWKKLCVYMGSMYSDRSFFPALRATPVTLYRHSSLMMNSSFLRLFTTDWRWGTSESIEILLPKKFASWPKLENRSLARVILSVLNSFLSSCWEPSCPTYS